MTRLFDQIQHFSKKNNLINPNATLVVGLSGGPDSVFLLSFLKYLQEKGIVKKIIAAHLDHQWRVDSAKDALFCQELTDQMNVPLIIGKLSDFSSAMKLNGSQEALGRAARRAFLEQVRKENQADAIALAHHLQDQEETFFIRLIRGTSLSGLSGMRPKAGAFIRPLLETNKHAIIDYLQTHTISYLIDPSNESPTFLRNRIRATVMPSLRACDSRFDQHFLSTIHRLQEAEHFLEKMTERSFSQIIETEDGRTVINLEKLFCHEPFIINRLIIHWLIITNVPFTPSQALIDELIRFLESPRGGVHQIHQNWQVFKKQNKAFIE